MNTSENQMMLDFLNKLLEKNPELRRQFTSFMSDDDAEQPCSVDAEKHIHDEAIDFKGKLEDRDLDDPDWERYTPRHSGYIPEWEAREHLAEDMISEQFEELKSDLENWFTVAKKRSCPACYRRCIRRLSRG